MPPHWPWVASDTPLLTRFCSEVKMIGASRVPTAEIFEPRLTSNRSLVASDESAAITTPGAMVSVTPAPPVEPRSEPTSVGRAGGTRRPRSSAASVGGVWSAAGGSSGASEDELLVPSSIVPVGQTEVDAE